MVKFTNSEDASAKEDKKGREASVFAVKKEILKGVNRIFIKNILKCYLKIAKRYDRMYMWEIGLKLFRFHNE